MLIKTILFIFVGTISLCSRAMDNEHDRHTAIVLLNADGTMTEEATNLIKGAYEGSAEAALNLGYYLAIGAFGGQDDIFTAVNWNRQAFLQGSEEVSRIAHINLRACFDSMNSVEINSLPYHFANGMNNEFGFTKPYNFAKARDAYALANFPAAHFCVQHIDGQLSPLSLKKPDDSDEEDDFWGVPVASKTPISSQDSAHLSAFKLGPKDYRSLRLRLDNKAISEESERKKQRRLLFQELQDDNGNVCASHNFLDQYFAKPVAMKKFVSSGSIKKGCSVCYMKLPAPIETAIAQEFHDQHGFGLTEFSSLSDELSEIKAVTVEIDEARHTLKAQNYVRALRDGLLFNNDPYANFYGDEYARQQVATGNFGTIIYDDNSLVKHLRENVHAGMNILDIGAATGANSYPLLQRGANVTALDISVEHLRDFWLVVNPELRKRLTLNTYRFPDQTNFAPENFDRILMSHVAHYLTGSELLLGLKQVHKWLKPEGLFYFQALSPYSSPFVWRSLYGDERFAAGEEWPYYFDGEEAGVHGMPGYGHPMRPAILASELRNLGFEIVSIDYAGFYECNQNIPYFKLESFMNNTMEAKDEYLFALNQGTKQMDILLADRTRFANNKDKYAKFPDDVKKHITREGIKNAGDLEPIQSMSVVQIIARKR